MEHQSGVNTVWSGNFRIAQIFDDDKFTDMGIRLFESVYPGQSDYYILKNDDQPFRYVTSPMAVGISADTPQQQAEFAAVIESRCAAVFLHAMSHKRQQMALLFSPKIVKVWFIWGYDLYMKWPWLGRRIFEPLTAQYLRKGKSSVYEQIKFSNFTFRLFRKSFESWFPAPLQKILHRVYPSLFYKAVRAMDVVAPIVPTEYQLVQSMGVYPVHAPFTYGNLEDLLGDKIEENVLHSRNILIGNSADPANNHVDVFKKLSGFDLGDRKVYVPLSYAGDQAYKAFVMQKGQEYLGDCFVPLTDFMKLEDYNQIIASCGFVIFNHIRQQGTGNIIAMGAMGAKIFMNPQSPAFQFYKVLGIEIFSTHALTPQALEKNLEAASWQHNRRIYFEQYSARVVRERARGLLAIVQQEINKKHS